MKKLFLHISILAVASVSMAQQVQKNTKTKVVVIEKSIVDTIPKKNRKATDISADSARLDSSSEFESFISLFPNNSVVIINHDTIIPAPKRRNKAPLIISEGSINLGFAAIDNSRAAITNSFPEIKNESSMHVGFNQEWGYKIGRGKFRLWYGLRYDIMNYSFSNSNLRLKGNAPIFTTSLDSFNNTDKSKVVVNYLGIPLSIGYQSNPKSLHEGFNIRAGIAAGYRVRAHTKVKLENDRTEKEFDDFNFNDFLVSPFVQVCYNNFGLYFRYNTSPIFKLREGPENYGMQFGIVMQ